MSTRKQKNEPDALAQAMGYEEGIADEAATTRGEEQSLTPELFMALRKLLRKPIPPAYIEQIPALDKGKPYESTGVRSVQVQIDRMDNVLTPLWWNYGEPDYSSDAKVCKVTVTVDVAGYPLIRSSYGGVQAGSGEGNIRKGAFTNAAKLAIARIGPGWEIYVGAPDLDPDVNKAVAEQQGAASSPEPESQKLSEERAVRLMEIVKMGGLEETLPAKLRSFGAKKLTDLTTEQAVGLYEWTQGG